MLAGAVDSTREGCGLFAWLLHYHGFITAFRFGRVLPALIVLAFCVFTSKVKIGVLFQMNDTRDRYEQNV